MKHQQNASVKRTKQFIDQKKFTKADFLVFDLKVRLITSKRKTRPAAAASRSSLQFH